MNRLEDIKLPENIDDITLTAVRRAKRDRKGMKGKKTVIAATIAACFIIGNVAASDAVRASIGNMMHKIETFFYGELKDDVIKDYKSNIAVTKESNGGKITLNEYFMDDENIYINVRLHSRDGKEIPQNAKYSIFLNGKDIPFESTSGGGNYQYNEDNSVDMILQRDIKKLELNSVEDVRIVFNTIMYKKDINKEDEEALKGNWQFDFKFNGEKLSSHVKNIEINKTINLKDVNMTIHSVKITPIKVSIKYSFDKEHSDKSIRDIGVGVINEKGELIGIGDGSGDLDYFIYNIIMDTKDRDEITLVPYKNGEDGVIYKDKAIKVKIK